MFIGLWVLFCIVGSFVMMYVNDHMKDGNDIKDED